MMRKLCALAAVASVLTAVPLAHGGPGDDDRFGVGSFRPVATFSVPGATSAEIVSATRDGMFLVYSDAIGRKFGLVDIRNPRRPEQVATLDAGGDPDQRGGPARGQPRDWLRSARQADPYRLDHVHEGGRAGDWRRARLGGRDENRRPVRRGHRDRERRSARQGLRRDRAAQPGGLRELTELDGNLRRSVRPERGGADRRRRSATGVREHPRDEGRRHPPGKQRRRDHRHQQPGGAECSRSSFPPA